MLMMQYPLEKNDRKRFIIFYSRKFLIDQKDENSKVRKKTDGAVKLYVPNKFSENISQSWSSKGIIGDIGGALRAFGRGAMERGAGKIGARLTAEYIRKTGAVVNPREELLYDGPQFRNFSFSFSFVPKNENETQVVRKIITFFKKYSLPEGSFNSGSLKFPNVWEMQVSDGHFTDMGWKDRTFAITSIDIDNAPEGEYVTLPNGFPARIDVVLTLQETRVLYQHEIEMPEE